MEKKTNFGEKSYVGYHPSSPCVEHSISDTPAFSRLSGDSFGYCPIWTSSEEASNSNSSDTIDDSSYASEPSPSRWTPGLSKLGLKLRKLSVDINKLDDNDLLDSGLVCIACVVILNFSS